MRDLPAIEELRRRTQSLAMLDAILSPEWEYRYYSFNSRWNAGERMASMRDGCGDHWFLHFTPAGAFLKGFAHETPMAEHAPWPGVLDNVPQSFASSLNEPAFMTEDTTFCLWREVGDAGWQQGPITFPSHADPDGSVALLRILDGDPDTYRHWAEDYYEVDLPIVAIEAVYAFQPLTQKLVAVLNATVDVEDIIEDATEIGYPVASKET